MKNEKWELIKGLFRTDLESFKKEIATSYLRKIAIASQASFGMRNSKNRDIWVEEQLQKIPMGLSILDAGAGEKQYEPLCAHLRYISQDFSQYTGKGNGQGLQTGTWKTTGIDIVSDITAIPVEDSSFDAVLCTEVLEHLPNPIEALRELSRVLKENGTILITAPFCSLTHFAPYFYNTGFSRYFYEYHLPRLGFKITDLARNGNYFEYFAQELIRITPTIESDPNSVEYREIDYLLLQRLMFLLENASKNQSDISDLLCFGYHVKAMKI